MRFKLILRIIVYTEFKINISIPFAIVKTESMLKKDANKKDESNKFSFFVDFCKKYNETSGSKYAKKN